MPAFRRTPAKERSSRSRIRSRLRRTTPLSRWEPALLSNPIYIGEIRHRAVCHPGLHEPILDRELWDAAQLLLRSHAVRRGPRATKSAPSPLTGNLAAVAIRRLIG